MTPRFLPVGKTGDIPAGEAKAFVVGDREIAVFNVDGAFHAIENTCPHQGGPLAEGFIDGTTVTCPWHAWSFDVCTGKMPVSEMSSVDAFDVQIDGSTISVSADPRV